MNPDRLQVMQAERPLVKEAFHNEWPFTMYLYKPPMDGILMNELRMLCGRIDRLTREDTKEKGILDKMIKLLIANPKAYFAVYRHQKNAKGKPRTKSILNSLRAPVDAKLNERMEEKRKLSLDYILFLLKEKGERDLRSALKDIFKKLLNGRDFDGIQEFGKDPVRFLKEQIDPGPDTKISASLNDEDDPAEAYRFLAGTLGYLKVALNEI